MNNISFKIVESNDLKTIHLIADWYLNEWHIPKEKTIQQFSYFSSNTVPFQLIMFLNDMPMATGGIYNHVGIVDIVPRFKAYKNWLALVYTTTENRGKGYGTMLCNEIEAHSKAIGIEELHLFTHTAESLYKRLDWQELERLTLKEKDIVVMNKILK
jgi:GNAT superfamily N-acetyltransferase